MTETIRRHEMIRPGDLVLAAVSGGADSLCLLHGLVRLRRLLRIDVACFHFDHGLRSDSSADAAYVRRQARTLGVPFHLRAADGSPGGGESVEAWARAVRYGALRAAVEEVEASAAAVGHTADDQAETVLLGLVRGGGLDALAGMPPVNRPVVRPLIDTTREETAAFCRSLGLRPRRDPMNEDPAFTRVALRLRAIPALEEMLGRNIRHTLARTATLLRRDALLLDRLADEAAAEVESADGADTLLDARGLTRLEPALGARVVRRALLSQGLVPQIDHVEAVLDLAASTRAGREARLPGGLRARRERGYVRLSRPSPGTR